DVGNPRERSGDVQAAANLPQPRKQSLDQPVNVVAIDERHLDVNLGELELAIRPLVFVAIATGNLKILLDAPDHKDLLELLRRLRQGVKLAGLAPARNQKLPRAFGRGLEQGRRLDFEES